VLPISDGANKGHFKENRRAAKRSPKRVLFLHDNAPAHRALTTQTKLAYLGFQCLDHPPYCPDLTPSDYHLFSALKNQLYVVDRHFSSNKEVIATAETRSDGQHSAFFLLACKSWSNGLNGVLGFVGSVVNKYWVWSL
jgi:hypothetical protein